MFTAALFTTAKTQKQPKCASTEEWKKKICYIYTMEYYSTIKNLETMPFAATWMDLEIIILSEVRKTQISYEITMQNIVKNDIKELRNQKQTQRF